MADRFGCSHYVLHRHRQHLPQQLTLAKQAEEVAAASTLLQRVESVIGECKAIVDSAKKGKDWSAAVAALREIRNNPADHWGFAVFNLQSHATTVNRDIPESEAPSSRMYRTYGGSLT